MPELADPARRSLGDLSPAGSRHNWARSGAATADGRLFVGGADGRVTAHRPDATPVDDWTGAGDPSAGDERYVVSLAATDDRLVVGERGPEGRVAALSPVSGEARWRYATASDVGTATEESLLFQPYVVDAAVIDDTVADRLDTIIDRKDDCPDCFDPETDACRHLELETEHPAD